MDEFPVAQPPEDYILEEEEFEKLYSASDQIIVLLSMFYGSISIIAVVGNLLVIWVVATTRQMRTVTNMYIANLAFADVIIGIFCIPFQFQAALLQRWNLPWFMCGFCPFIQVLSVNVSVFTLTAIAIDRHRAIINPLRLRPDKALSKFIICCIWTVAVLFAIPCAIAFRVDWEHERFKEGELIFNVSRPFCMNKNLTEDQLRAYRYMLVFVQYLVPFCVICFVYIQMAVKLWGNQTPGNAQDSRDITLLRNKKKVIKMLMIVVVVFGLCWLPLQLYNILYVTFPSINEYHFISIVWFFCDWFAMSNSCYNPFIYGIYNEKFKREFNKRFSSCFCKFHTGLDQPERTASIHTRASSVRSTFGPTAMRFGTKHNRHTFNPLLAAASGVAPNSTALVGLHGPRSSTGTHASIIYQPRPLSEGALSSRHDEGGRRCNFQPFCASVVEQEDNESLSEEIRRNSCDDVEAGRSADAATNVMLATSSGVPCLRCICEKELNCKTTCNGKCTSSGASRLDSPLTEAPENMTTTMTTGDLEQPENTKRSHPLSGGSTPGSDGSGSIGSAGGRVPGKVVACGGGRSFSSDGSITPSSGGGESIGTAVGRVPGRILDCGGGRTPGTGEGGSVSSGGSESVGTAGGRVPGRILDCSGERRFGRDGGGTPGSGGGRVPGRIVNIGGGRSIGSDGGGTPASSVGGTPGSSVGGTPASSGGGTPGSSGGGTPGSSGGGTPGSSVGGRIPGRVFDCGGGRVPGKIVDIGGGRSFGSDGGGSVSSAGGRIPDRILDRGDGRSFGSGDGRIPGRMIDIGSGRSFGSGGNRSFHRADDYRRSGGSNRYPRSASQARIGSSYSYFGWGFASNPSRRHVDNNINEYSSRSPNAAVALPLLGDYVIVDKPTTTGANTAHGPMDVAEI